jgi:hypothetical protein
LRFELLRFYTARVTLRLPGSIGRCLLCPAIPEARDGTPKACQLTTLTAKPAAFSKTLAQSARRALWRTGDHGIDLVGIERAVNHQRLGDGEHRRAMLDNERVGFLCTELKIGIDRGF